MTWCNLAESKNHPLRIQIMDPVLMGQNGRPVTIPIHTVTHRDVEQIPTQPSYSGRLVVNDGRTETIYDFCASKIVIEVVPLSPAPSVTLEDFYAAWDKSITHGENYIGKSARESAMVQAMAEKLGLK
jgi:hypothetical protein